MRRKIIIIRIPKSAKEVIKSTDTGNVVNVKTAEDSIKGIDFKLSSPVSNEENAILVMLKLVILYFSVSVSGMLVI